LRRAYDELDERVAERTTELVQTNRMLNAEKERFTALIEASPAAIFMKNLEGRYVLVNRRFGEWYGYNPELAAGLTSHDVFEAAEADSYVAMDHEVLTSGAVVTNETQINPPGEAPRWIIINKFPIRDGEGEVIGVGTINTDITDKVLAEKELEVYRQSLEERVEERTAELNRQIRARESAAKELRESEERFRDVAEVASDWIWETDAQHRFTFVSAPLSDASPTLRAAVLGRSVSDVISDPRITTSGFEPLGSLQSHAAFREEPIELQIASVNKPWHMVLNGKPVFDEGGEFCGYRGTARDVSREIEAQTLARRNERLAAIGQVTATVSHELRNPLATISASTTFLKHSLGDLGPPIAGAVARLERSIERCCRIIDELLDYGRVRELARQAVIIDDWLEAMLDDYELPATVQLKRELAAGATLEVDTEKLRQAIVNVLQNAVQASTERHGPDFCELTVSCYKHGTGVAIEVKDNGPGMSPSVCAQIFEPLFSTRNFGVGLGLPLVKQIVEQHGGKVEVHSEPDRGTTVMLWLPL
jgi:PAS domain S-box-containing protein